MAKYICVRKCYFGKGETVNGKAPPRRIYNVGDVETFEPGERVPRHFESFETFVPEKEDAGKILLKGVRAPIDKDQLEKLERKRRAATSPVDAHKRGEK